MQTSNVKIIPIFEKKTNSDKISVNTNWSVKRHPRASQADLKMEKDNLVLRHCITVE